MRIEQLYYLVEISKQPSLNLASEKLHISHQSLNKSIKSLEEELGTELLLRSSTGITLTTNGKRTVQAAKNILKELDDLKHFISHSTDSSSAISGSLSVLCTPLTAGTILVPLIRTLSEDYPNINISSLEVMPHEVLIEFKNHTYDFALLNISTNDFNITDFSNYTFEILSKERVYALVNRKSPLSRNKSISVKKLLKNPIIIYGYSYSEKNMVANLISNYGTLSNYMYTNNQSILYENLINKQYISLMTPALYHSTDPIVQSQCVIIPLKEKLESYTILLFNKQSKNKTISELVIRLIKDHVSK